MKKKMFTAVLFTLVLFAVEPAYAQRRIFDFFKGEAAQPQQ